MLIVSCSEQDITPTGRTDSTAPVFTASLFQCEISKTYVGEDLKLYWTEDDRVSIFFNTYNQQYKFDGATGDNSGTFSKIPTDDFVAALELDRNYAIYPYSASNKITYQGLMSLTLPAVQHFAEGSFGPATNTMVAVTENIDDKCLLFKNLCGYLVVKLYGECTVKSVSLKGKNGEKLAGEATCQPQYGEAPSIVWGSNTSDEITLDCGDGVELGKTEDSATLFWFAVPPVSFENGFTIQYTTANGVTKDKSTSIARTIERNVVNQMEPLKCSDLRDVSLVLPPDNEIWYTSTTGNIIDLPSYPVTLVSNTYENGKGIYRFASDISTLPPVENVQELTSLVLPSKITSLDSYAFESLKNLKTLVMPELLSYIGIDVFDAVGYNYKDDDSAVDVYFIRETPPSEGWRAIWNLYPNFNFYYPSTADYSDVINQNINSWTLIGRVLNEIAPGVWQTPELKLWSWIPVEYHLTHTPKISDVAVTSVTLSDSSIELPVGGKFTLVAIILPENATNKNVSWSSSNSTVASVDQSGKVTANSEGSAVITVTTADGGKTATCSVTVTGGSNSLGNGGNILTP